MKRLFALFFIIVILSFTLCACGQAQNTAPSPTATSGLPTLAAGSHGVEATPYVRTEYSVEIEEREQSEAEVWDESYRHIGKLYSTKSEMEYLQSLPQDAEAVFAVNDMFGYKNDPRVIKYDTVIDLDLRNHELFERVACGDMPEGEYDFDRSAYTWATDSYANEYLDKLPLEWFENQQTIQDLINEYDENSITDIMNEYTLKTAETFASFDIKCEVRSNTHISNASDHAYYMCFVYTTSEKL